MAESWRGGTRSHSQTTSRVSRGLSGASSRHQDRISHPSGGSSDASRTTGRFRSIGNGVHSTKTNVPAAGSNADSDVDSVMDSPPASLLSCEFSTPDLTECSDLPPKDEARGHLPSTIASEIESRYATVVMEGEEANTVLSGGADAEAASPESPAASIRDSELATVLSHDVFVERSSKASKSTPIGAAHVEHNPRSERPLKDLAEHLNVAERVDVCFLVDCTGSMDQWIHAVRNNIRTLYQRIQDVYNRRCHIRAAFVGYSDFEYTYFRRNLRKPNLYVLDFTTSPAEFHDYVSSVRPVGGEDCAEDVMTGLERAFELSWREKVTKLIIHIADDPCHGRMYHGSDVSDYYPDGDPFKRSHTDMMKTMAKMDIQYYFGEVTRRTGKMVSVFNDSLKRESCGRLTITTFKAISPDGEEFSQALFSAVRSSIFHTLHTLSTPYEQRPACSEIDPTLPDDFLRFPAKSATAMRFEMPASIDDDILTNSSMKLLSYDVSLRMAAKPFAQGCLRLAYHALDVMKNKRVVVKQSRFTNPEYNRFKRYLEDMEAQAVAARFMTDFKKALPCDITVNRKIEVLVAKVIKLQTAYCEEDRFMVLEPYLTGKYTKFSNNAFSQCSGSDLEKLMQAFSHWTYWRSNERMVVVDLQGSVHQGVTYLTDPAIHCVDGKRFGKTTNFGIQGVRMFFAGHECNKVCRALRLKPCTVV